MCLCGIFPQ
uniref:Uncharacterized protein n=1 Tax=Anguilla anguilla TaxID=7936 RepID=A0A0E9PAA1_ANGAN